MSEILSAYDSKFNEKADKYIARAQDHLIKKQAELAEWEELYPFLLAEFTMLSEEKNFTAVFPAGGGAVGVTSLNQKDSPEYQDLIGFDDDLDKKLKRLIRLSDSIEDVASAENSVASEKDKKTKGSEYLLNRIRGLFTGENDKNWKQFLKFPTELQGILGSSGMNRDDIYNEAPRQVVNSSEFIAALTEAGPNGKVEEETAPINDTETAPINEEAAPINEVEETESQDGSEDGPINEGDGTVGIETETSSVESATPALEKEETPKSDGTVVPADVSEQSDNFTEVVPPAPINEPADKSTFDTNSDGVININEYTDVAKQGDVFNDIVENSINEVSNITNQNEVAQEKLDTTEAEYTAGTINDESGEVINEEPTSTDLAQNIEGDITVINETVESSNSVINEIGDRDDLAGPNVATSDDIPPVTGINDTPQDKNVNIANNIAGSSFTQDDISATLDFLRKGNAKPTSISEEDNSVINEIDESSESSINNVDGSVVNESDNSVINEIDESSESIKSSLNVDKSPKFLEGAKNKIKDKIGNAIEVTKSKLGIDKKIAPINTPDSPEEDDVKLTEVEPIKADTPVESKPEAPSSVSNTDTSNTSTQVSPTNIDMSEVVARLRKIENALAGPLDVKIID